ncbi:OmpH family outer membrane protein [Rufibacter sp. LB8]|uniref:OmpH family outer membrane protein n=1 Tax=Rufibacter sp. LB8 TaxID=2777781 RepID=UPI00351C4585
MKVTRSFLALALATASFSACKTDTKDAATTAGTTTTTDSTTTVTTAPEPAVTDTVAMPAARPEIVYINSDSLLTKYQLFKDVKARLEGKGKRLETDLRTKADAFRKEVAQYQQTGANMTQEQRATTERALAQKEQQIAAQQQNAGNQLAQDENTEMKKIYEKVEAYLKRESKNKGYKMVLTYSRGNSAILYSDPSLDITAEVLKGLNEEYRSTKKK